MDQITQETHETPQAMQAQSTSKKVTLLISGAIILATVLIALGAGFIIWQAL